MKRILAVGLFSMIALYPLYADAGACQRIPQCHYVTSYQNRAYQQQICQYFGTQRSCYIATRYQMVPVQRQECTYYTYCPGGFSGLLRRYKG